jgi:hypothetical protein
MNIKELEKLLQELKQAKIEIAKISRIDGSKLIIDATEYLLRNGKSLDSDAKIELALRMIKLYEDFEKKLDLAIDSIENEISELNSEQEQI